MTWVFDHSPYTLGARLVHLAIADIVNDDNDWLLWASKARIAKKAKVSPPTVTAAFVRMLGDGYLELVEERVGAPSVYRFLRPSTPQESEPSPAVDPPSSQPATPQAARRDPPSSEDPSLFSTQGEPNVEQNGDDSRWEGADALCARLADRMQSRNGHRPAISRQWRRDMDLLLRRGPSEWDEPQPIPTERVARVIDGIFSILGEPEGNSTFCWADVVQSPGNLRRKWDRIVVAGRAKFRAAARDPLASSSDVERRLRGGDPLGAAPTNGRLL